MDIALGLSMTPTVLRMVLTEGEGADGVTVDREFFDVAPGEAMSERVVATLAAARAGAAEAGNRLTSAGVAFSDPVEADLLRDALQRNQLDNVMVVSAFLAAVALAQAAGSSVGYAHTALMFVEPATATVAIVNSTDGSVTDVRRHHLGETDLVTQLSELLLSWGETAGAADGVFMVGSGVPIAPLKAQLEAATGLPISVPGDPDLALARGAALASGHAPLFASSTQAIAWAQDLGTGWLDPAVLQQYLQEPTPDDYSRTENNAALAYSALPDAECAAASPVTGAFERLDSGQLDFRIDDDGEHRRRWRLVAAGVAAAIAVAGAAVAVSVSVGIGSARHDQTTPGAHVVPSREAPVTPAPQAPAPAPAPQAPAPAPQAPAPAPEAPAPAPQAPAPAPEAVAPAPVAPAPAPRVPAVQAPPAPAPPPPLLPPIIPIPIPGLPQIGGPFVPSPQERGGDDRWQPKRGGVRGDDRGDDDRPWTPKVPFGGDDDRGHGKFDIPGIPGL